MGENPVKKNISPMMSIIVMTAPTLLLPLDGIDGGIGAVGEGGAGAIGGVGGVGCIGWTC